jgi:hypothetical protein
MVNILYWIKRDVKMTLLPIRQRKSQTHTIVAGFGEFLFYTSAIFSEHKFVSMMSVWDKIVSFVLIFLSRPNPSFLFCRWSNLSILSACFSASIVSYCKLTQREADLATAHLVPRSISRRPRLVQLYGDIWTLFYVHLYLFLTQTNSPWNQFEVRATQRFAASFAFHLHLLDFSKYFFSSPSPL